MRPSTSPLENLPAASQITHARQKRILRAFNIPPLDRSDGPQQYTTPSPVPSSIATSKNPSEEPPQHYSDDEMSMEELASGVDNDTTPIGETNKDGEHKTVKREKGKENGKDM